MPPDEDGVATALALIKSLEGSNWEPQSSRNPSYNCFAWAGREWYHWVDPPGTAPWTYWPEDLPEWDSVDNYIRLYERLGFSCCEDGEPSDQFEKIALFADSSQSPQHAARQLRSGRWTSKFGKGIDFEHDLDTINGDPAVGSVVQFMKRPWPLEEPPGPPPGLLVPDPNEGIPDCVFE